ncbi:hypothetical protein BKA93DRAFT_692396, partial [Sparassis latifolia]
DRRFQEHYSFLFTAFNILQRRAVLLHSKIRINKLAFSSVASEIATISPSAVAKLKQGYAIASNTEEYAVLKLMKEVKLVTSHVDGSSSAKLEMCNEIRGMMMHLGLPSFYITINPANVYNLLVKFLAGDDIDIDNMMSNELPNYWDQSILIARNPAIAAKFFNIYMKAFFNSLLNF